MSSSNKSGYTILEVLVAMVILGIVMPGLSYMVITSRQTQVGNHRFEAAAAMGQQVYDSLSLLPANLIAAGERSSSLDGQNYTARWTVAPDPAAGRTLAIMVEWNVGGKLHSSTLNGALR